jgi:membrane protease YdiL (CAAX protease family)
MSISSFVKRNPILTYFALTFAISWGGILLVMVRTGGIPATKEQFEMVIPSAIPALLGGPTIAGLLLTGLVYGREGFRDILSRLLRWRVGVRWYTVALLIGPLVLLVELLALSLYSPVFLPGIFASDDKAYRLVFGIAAALSAGIFEELGWTGFAIPRLRLRYGIVATGLIVGVLWGAWHILANVIFASGAYAGGLSPAVFITARGFGDLVGILPAYRVLMVWVYDRTGSLPVAMLMHVSLTAATIIFEPQGIAGVSLVIYDSASTAAMWAVVAAVVVAHGGRLTRQPLQRRMS